MFLFKTKQTQNDSSKKRVVVPVSDKSHGQSALKNFIYIYSLIAHNNSMNSVFFAEK